VNLVRQIKADLQWYRAANEHRGLLSVLGDRFFWVCANYRIGRWASQLRIPLIRTLARLAYGLLNLVVSTITSCDIRSGAKIGQRFLVHSSRGLLITKGVCIGDDCVVNSGVCIVNRANNRGEGVPVIGNGVRIGVGAKILGGITVGDGAVIGANAVVIQDVPAGHLAVGVPAQIKPLRRSDTSAERATTAL
jgi:serine O-acetyltransferase